MPMDPDYMPACTYCDDRGCMECEVSIHLTECEGCDRCTGETTPDMKRSEG